MRSLKTLTEINEIPAADFISRYARPWESLFDDSSTAPLLLLPSGGWAIEKGALVSSGGDCTLATRDDVEDGEIRLRFRAESIGALTLGVRVAGPKGYVLVPDPATINASRSKVHEVVFTCKGDQVTGLLDGKDVPLKPRSGPRKGPLQVRVTGGGHLVIVSLERR